MRFSPECITRSSNWQFGQTTTRALQPPETPFSFRPGIFPEGRLVQPHDVQSPKCVARGGEPYKTLNCQRGAGLQGDKTLHLNSVLPEDCFRISRRRVRVSGAT